MVSSTNSYFQKGLEHWEKEDYQLAEQYWRYAAYQGHEHAKEALEQGIALEYLMDEEQRLNGFAVEILETFVCPEPSQALIDELEIVLRNYLKQQTPKFRQ